MEEAECQILSAVVFSLYLSGLLVEPFLAIARKVFHSLSLICHAVQGIQTDNPATSESFIYRLPVASQRKFFCFAPTLQTSFSSLPWLSLFFFFPDRVWDWFIINFRCLIVLLWSRMGRWDFQLLWMLGSPGGPGPAALPAVPDKWACAVVARGRGLMGLQRLGQERPQML